MQGKAGTFKEKMNSVVWIIVSVFLSVRVLAASMPETEPGNNTALGNIPLKTEPLPPVPNPNPSRNSASDAVGSVAGAFLVDESGQAIYKVPIFAPVGTAGVTPKLSLSYNSSGSNGLVGKGWSLDGLSVISRCRQTLHQDGAAKPIGWDQSDRFCLDGQRLVVVSGIDYGSVGAEYRTEIDSFTTIVSIGGTPGAPDYFELQAKDGSISVYGSHDANTNSEQNARDLNGVETGNTLTWAMSKFQDSAKNKIVYTYKNDASGHRIGAIKYAYGGSGPYNAKISFSYKNRTDGLYGYVAGYQFKMEKLLKSIKVSNDGDIVRQYKLKYMAPNSKRFTNQLKQLQECSNSSCYKPTDFSWMTQKKGFSVLAKTTQLDNQNDRVSIHKHGDINGDGFTDLIWQEGDRDDGGKVHDQYWKYALFNPDSGNYGVHTTFYETSSNPDDPFTWAVLDYNQDGFTDVLIPVGGVWRIYLSSGFGYSDYITTSISVNELDPVQVLDLNSDGLADLVYTDTNDNRFVRYMERIPSGDEWVSALSNSPILLKDMLPAISEPLLFGGYYEAKGGDFLTVGEFNGDGLMDIVGRLARGVFNCITPPGGGSECTDTITYEYDLVVFTATSNGSFERYATVTVPGSLLSGEADDIRIGDFNADGLADLLIQTLGDHWYVELNTGTGFKELQNLGDLPNDSRISVVDINNDGYAEIVYPYSNSLAARFYDSVTDTVAGVLSPLGISIGDDDNGDQYYIMDANGDGVVDYINFDSENSRLTLRNGLARPSLITQIDNNLGNLITISYSPLTDRSIYQNCRDSSACTSGSVASWGMPIGTQTLPSDAYEVVFDITPSSYVVGRVSSSAPSADNDLPGEVDFSATSSTSYLYKGAKVQAGGRGMLGFAQVWQIDEQDDIWTLTQYRQDFPFIGKPIYSETFSGSNLDLISSHSSTWRFRDWGSGHEVAPYNLFRAFGTDVSYDFETGDELAYNITRSADPDLGVGVDEWGNVLFAISESYDDVNHDTPIQRTTTTNNYDDIDLGGAASSRYGRLSRKVITHHRQGTEDITRSSDYSYYSSGNKWGLLAKEIIEPGNVNQITKVYKYDSRGNLTKTKQVGKAGKNGSGATQTRYTRWEYDLTGRYIDRTYQKSGTRTLPSPVNGNPGELLTEHVVGRNNLGQPAQVLDLYSVNTIVDYGELGREFHRYNETGKWQTSTNYDSPGEHCPLGTRVRTETKTADGQLSTRCLDAVGRTIRSSSLGFLGGDYIYQDTEFDGSGRVKHQSAPYNYNTTPQWTSHSYDKVGRLRTVVLPDGNVITTSHNGLSTTVTNPKGHVITKVRNILDELVLSTDHRGANIAYTYDAVGNLIATNVSDVESGKNIVTTLNYDVFGRKISMSDPDKGNWSYAYNTFGELVEQIDGKGQKSKMTYDVGGRMRIRKEYWGSGRLAEESRWIYDDSPNFAQYPGRLIETTLVSTNANGTTTGTEGKLYDYDRYGRAIGSSETLDGGVIYQQSVTYDQYGRIFQKFDITGDDWGTESIYNNRGFLEQVLEARYTDINDRTVYYSIGNMDSMGNITHEKLGNGEIIKRSYDDVTGNLVHITANSVSGLKNSQDMTFTYDELGNLSSRNDQRQNYNLRESFCYDHLNRLVKVNHNTTISNCGGIDHSNGDIQYDGFGNITSKLGVGSYVYGAGSAGPHAVTSTAGTNYTYDDNGNMKSGDGRQISYSVFDKTTQITKGSDKSEFKYGINRNRFLRKDTINGDITTIGYFGNTEVVNRPDGSREIRRSVGGRALVKHLLDTNGQVISTSNAFLLKDHLGSVAAVMDEVGNVVQSMSFDAWGQRRNAGDWTSLSGIFLPGYSVNLTTRGFTGHEMVDAVGLVHMNGRIYDAKLGRFLQADPFVQSPSNSQSYNRYSYVMNNPLVYSDPSGYFSLRDLAKVAAVVAVSVASYGAASSWATGVGIQTYGGAMAITGAQYASVSTIAGIVGGAAAGFAGGVSMAAFSGASFGDSLKTGVKGAFSGAVFGGIGGHYGETWNSSRVAANSLAGGVNSKLNGKEFHEGAKVSMVVSLLTLANYKMRRQMIKQSEINGDNIGKDSGGFFADGRGIAGTRRIPNPEYGLVSDALPYLKCDGPAGGCQGPIKQINDVGSRLGPVSYESGDLLDLVSESFAGPHDWLSNRVGMYDAMGNGMDRSGNRVSGMFYEAVSYGLIPIAVPFSVPALIDTTHGVHNLIHVIRDN